MSDVTDKDASAAGAAAGGWGVRHVQALMLFLGLFLAFSMRVNMSMAIVAMTDPQDPNSFDWSVGVQSVILSSYFWGYVVLQVPAGEVAARCGGKLLLTISLGVNSVVSLLIPLASYYGGWKVVCACRVLQGLTQGCIYPSFHNLIGKWAPLEERGSLGTFIYSGAQLGTAIQQVVSGQVAGSWGWPVIFYLNGGLGAAWTALYVFIGANSPQSCGYISQRERNYIQTSLGHVAEPKKLRTPWKKLLTSWSFIALIIVHCGQNWGFWTLMTEMPSYFSLVLGVNIKSNGMLSALPYFAMWLMSFPFGFLADYALKKQWLSVTAVRKISNSIDGWGVRHVTTGLLFLAMLLLFMMRANMSLAIVAMTDPRDPHHVEWDMRVQARTLSSFFWGYVVLQVPAGELARRAGGHVLVTAAVAINAIVCMAIPHAAWLGSWQAVVACRVVQGLSQACVYPAMHHLVSQWVPAEECLLTTIIYSGGQMGIAIQLLISGFLASAFGWASIFYTNGILGAVWVVASLALGAGTPTQSKYISDEEVQYIHRSLGKVGPAQRCRTPWRRILTSRPFWAVVVAHCGQNWGFFTLMTEIPTYLTNVHGVQLNTNGVLSSLPYVAMCALSFMMGYMTDLITRRGWLGVSNTRKLFNTIGLWGAAGGMVCLAFIPGGHTGLAVGALVLTVGVNAGQFAGFMLVHIDLASNFSSTLMGVTNFLANIVSIIAPLVCGAIVSSESSEPRQWMWVFALSAGIYFMANLYFIVFATSDTQPWNQPHTDFESPAEAESPPEVESIAMQTEAHTA